MTAVRGWSMTRWGALGCILLVFSIGCGTGGNKQSSTLTPGGALINSEGSAASRNPTVHPVTMRPQPPTEPSFDASVLPSPSEIAAGTSAGLSVSGAQYQPRGGQAVASEGYAVLSPTASLAWAAYRLGFGSDEARAGRQTIGLTWDAERSPDLSQLWIGLSRNGTWEWFSEFEDDVLTVESLSTYATGDTASVLIVLTGGPMAALERVTLGQPEMVGSGFIPSPTPIVGTRQASLKRVSDYPASCDLSADFPPVHYQGLFGSCTAFAVGDGAFNYELGQIYSQYGWDFNDDFNLVGPRYLYVETAVDDQGCGETDGRYLGGSNGVVQWLQDPDNGVATELNADYDAADFCEPNWSSEALDDAALLRSTGSDTITSEQAGTVDAIKSVLVDDGRPVILGMVIDQAFYNYDGTPEVWNWTGPSIGGHAVVIVGYDDSKDAFKIRNSWSEFWGIDGYGWIGYDTLSTNTLANPELYCIWAEFDDDVMARFCPGPPGTPGNVSATDGSILDRVRITWDAVEGATEYKVYRATSENGTYSQIGAPTTNQCDMIGGVTTTYWFKIKAWNPYGESGFSSADSGYVGLAAPTNVAATDGTMTDRVRVTWTASLGADFYQVYRATTVSGTYSAIGSTTSTQYDDVISGTTAYYYKVRAGITGVGYSTTAPTNGTSGYAGVATPTNFAATDGTITDRVRLTWTAVGGSPLDYRIYRATSANGSYSLVGYTTGTQYDDLLPVSTTYYYKIRTRTSAGYSATSAAEAGNAGLAMPANFAATDGAYTSYVRLTWDAVSGVLDYRIYRATSANGTYSLVATTTATAYNYTESTNSVYYYKIRARNASGYSQTSTAEAGNAGLNAPTNMGASDGTFPDKVRVTWTAASGAGYYQVYRATSANGSYALRGTTTNTTFDDTVGDTSTYYYKVRAGVTNVGYSAFAGPDAGSKGS